MPANHPENTTDIDDNSNNTSRWCAEDFTLRKIIGSGGFARVYEAEETLTGKTFALKIMSRAKISTANAESLVSREIDLHQLLNHPNIVHCFGSFSTDKWIYLVLDHCEEGSLLDLLTKNGKLPEKKAASFTQQIALALQYCHGQDILHRDIKTENILVNGDRVLLSDFGHSIASKEPRFTKAGTFDFLSPEQISETFYTKESDLWSFGAVIFEMLTTTPPFYDADRNMTELLIKEAAFLIPKYVSSEARDLIHKLLQKDPKERLPLVRILKHDWIVKYCGEIGNMQNNEITLAGLKIAPAKPLSAFQKAKRMLKKYDIE